MFQKVVFSDNALNAFRQFCGKIAILLRKDIPKWVYKVFHLELYKQNPVLKMVKKEKNYSVCQNEILIDKKEI